MNLKWGTVQSPVNFELWQFTKWESEINEGCFEKQITKQQSFWHKTPEINVMTYINHNYIIHWWGILCPHVQAHKPFVRGKFNDTRGHVALKWWNSRSVLDRQRGYSVFWGNRTGRSAWQMFAALQPLPKVQYSASTASRLPTTVSWHCGNLVGLKQQPYAWQNYTWLRFIQSRGWKWREIVRHVHRWYV